MPGEANWKAVAAEPVLSRESPAHVVGEELWWAGEKVPAMTVRIAVADGSGNQTVRQFALEPADPQVDQAALARELGVPPLPTADMEAPMQAVPVAPAARPAASGDSWAAGRPLEYRGRPLHMAKSRRFAWDYEAQDPLPGGGRMRAELWTTRDGGVTWQRAAVDADGRSPIDVQLPAAGLYGVRLELMADVPDTGDGPRSGDEPQAWLGIDDEPPQVELLGVARDPQDASVLVIRYVGRDPLLLPTGGRLLYSPNAEGPWATIADGLAAEGEHRWRPDRTVPARVHVRVEVADAAGNVGSASSTEAVTVAGARVVGRLGGLRAAPDAGP